MGKKKEYKEANRRFLKKLSFQEGVFALPCGIHAFNSSTVGFSSTINRFVNSMLFSVNHFLAFWHVLHAGYCKNNVAIFIYNLIFTM